MQSAYVDTAVFTMARGEAQNASDCATHKEPQLDTNVDSFGALPVPSTALARITARPWAPDDCTDKNAKPCATDEVVVSFHYSDPREIDDQRVAHVKAAHLEFDVELDFELQPEELASGDAFGLIFEFATEVRLLRALPEAVSDTAWHSFFIHTTRLSLSGWKKFESLEVLHAFDALEVLNLSGTGIKTLEGISSLKTLQVLDISRCASLKGTFEMAHLPRLRFLDVSATDGLLLSRKNCRALECVRATGRFMESYMRFVDPQRKL